MISGRMRTGASGRRRAHGGGDGDAVPEFPGACQCWRRDRRWHPHLGWRHLSPDLCVFRADHREPAAESVGGQTGRFGGMKNRTMKFVKNGVDRWEVC